MKSINEMHADRAKLIHDAQALTHAKDYGADQEAQVNDMLADAARIQARIENAQKLEAMQASSQASMMSTPKAGSEEAEFQARHKAAFRNYMLNGNDISAEDRKVLAQGVFNPQGAQSSITGNKGGFTVPKTMYDTVELAMKSFSGVLEAGATVLQTEDGQEIQWPTVNDTSTKGALISENPEENAGSDITFGQKTLKAYTYSSKPILVPFQLLEDSVVDLDQLCGQIIGERFGRILNEHFTIGDGTDKPEGIVPASVLGKTAADDATLTIDELIDLKYSIDPAYRIGAKFMCNNDTLKTFVKMKDLEGRPIFVPSYRDGEADKLLNHTVVVNNDMAGIAASAKPVVFGDISKYRVRRVKSIVVRRLEERFADVGQVAFLAFHRADGRLMDAGTGPVKHIVMAAS